MLHRHVNFLFFFYTQAASCFVPNVPLFYRWWIRWKLLLYTTFPLCWCFFYINLWYPSVTFSISSQGVLIVFPNTSTWPSCAVYYSGTLLSGFLYHVGQPGLRPSWNVTAHKPHLMNCHFLSRGHFGLKLPWHNRFYKMKHKDKS